MKYYAEGISVVPLKPRSKEPLVKLREYQKELPSMNEIWDWFISTNNNVGIVTGKVSNGLVVVNVNDEGLFRESYKRLDDDLKHVENNTWVVKTDKGYQIYLRVFGEGKDIPRSRTFNGIEVIGEGGYVVAPPSVLRNGVRYEFLDPKTVLTRPIRTLFPEEFKIVMGLITELTKK